MLKFNSQYFIIGLVFCGISAFGQTQKKPNPAFLFVDQLRADVLGYHGDPKAITPNIDRFANEAINFTNAVSVSPVCAP